MNKTTRGFDNSKRETPLGPGAKKDGCLRRLMETVFDRFVINDLMWTYTRAEFSRFYFMI